MEDRLKGVTRESNRLRRKFKAVIRINGKLHHIGYFASKEEAHAAHLKAKEELKAITNK